MADFEVNVETTRTLTFTTSIRYTISELVEFFKENEIDSYSIDEEVLKEYLLESYWEGDILSETINDCIEESVTYVEVPDGLLQEVKKALSLKQPLFDKGTNDDSVASQS